MARACRGVADLASGVEIPLKTAAYQIAVERVQRAESLHGT